MAQSNNDELVIMLTTMSNRIQKRIGGPLSAHGISYTEYLVLRQLHRAQNKKLRRIDLAESVGLSASGVTRLLNPMQKVGLVQKEDAPRDARVSLVALTRVGEEIFRDASRTFSDHADDLLAAIGNEEKQTLARLAAALL